MVDGGLHYTPVPLRLDIIESTGLSNPVCKQPPEEARGPAAPAFSYSELATNTTIYPQNESSVSQLGYGRDLNGDGLDDLFWLETEYDEQAFEMTTWPRVWLSNGNGSFSDGTDALLPEGLSAADVPRQFYRADIDGDGDEDYIVLQHGFDPSGINGRDCLNSPCPGAPNLIIKTAADGTLVDVAPTALNPYDVDGFTHAGGVADVDCDGDMDILEGQLTLDTAPAPHRLQINDGTGHFQAKTDFMPSAIEWIGMYGAVLCDLDRDGDADIFVSQPGDVQGLDWADVVFENDGYGNFSLLPGRRLPESRLGDDHQRAADTRCFDFDGDGYMDLLKPNEADPNYPAFELLRNRGDMTFVDVTDEKLPQAALTEGSYRPEVVDLNNDGWPDILAAGTAEFLRIYWNTGDGFAEFIFPSDTAIDTRSGGIIPGDFNGDGKLDIHVGRGPWGDFILRAN